MTEAYDGRQVIVWTRASGLSCALVMGTWLLPRGSGRLVRPQAGKYGGALMGQIPKRDGWTRRAGGGPARRIRPSGCSTESAGTPSGRWEWCAGFSRWPTWMRLPTGAGRRSGGRCDR